MKDNLLQKLKALNERYMELERLIATPATLANPAQYGTYMKERGSLSRIVQRYLQFTQLLQQKEEAERIVSGREDKEFQHLAREELQGLEAKEKELMEELKESREIIEKRLGSPCPYFCWPYGKYNDLAVNVAKKTEYKALFTTNHGVVETGSDPFAINRIIVKDSIVWFKKRMVVYTNTILSKLYLKIKKK